MDNEIKFYLNCTKSEIYALYFHKYIYIYIPRFTTEHKEVAVTAVIRI